MCTMSPPGVFRGKGSYFFRSRCLEGKLIERGVIQGGGGGNQGNTAMIKKANNFLQLLFLAGEVEYFDDTLRFVQGKGWEGKIWLTGCLHSTCLVSHRVKVTMTVSDNGRILRSTSFYILPYHRPFPVDGLLLLNPGETNVIVDVYITVGPGERKHLRFGKEVQPHS